MIDSLTPEQEARFGEFRVKWIQVGLATGPCEFETCKAAAIEAYKVAGLEPPEEFHLCDSPMSAAHFICELMGVEPTEENVRSRIMEMIHGNHDAGWLSFYDYIGQVLGLECCNDLIPLNTIAQNGGWWSAYDTCAIFQHRPCEIHFDDRELLHNENGPAILYRDGFAVYAWHGVRVPAEWIEDKTSIPPETALNWPDMEQRHAASEIIGWINVLEQLNARTIEKHSNPLAGELVEADIPDVGAERFLRVTCGTGRLFALPVPPEIETVEAAQRWLNFIPDDIPFLPEIRT